MAAPLTGWQHTRRLNNVVTWEAPTVNGVNEYTSIAVVSQASPPDPVVPGYDDNGNLTADPTAPNAGGQAAGQTHTYDVENRLTQVTRTSDSQVLLQVRYDPIGRRVESVEHIDPSDGQAYSVAQVTRHIHAGLTPVVDYNVSSDGVGGYLNTRLREFIWGGPGAPGFPEPVALIDWTAAEDVGSGTAEVLHYIHDALGGVVGLTNAAGALVERYTYDPYGQTYIEDPATQTFRGWDGGCSGIRSGT